MILYKLLTLTVLHVFFLNLYFHIYHFPPYFDVCQIFISFSYLFCCYTCILCSVLLYNFFYQVKRTE